MDAAGIPVGRVNTVSQAFASAETVERGAVVTSPHPILGEVHSVASPFVMSGTPVVDPVAPPLLGQHSRDILADVLGWSDERISGAIRDGTVGETAVTGPSDCYAENNPS